MAIAPASDTDLKLRAVGVPVRGPTTGNGDSSSSTVASLTPVVNGASATSGKTSGTEA